MQCVFWRECLKFAIVAPVLACFAVSEVSAQDASVHESIDAQLSEISQAVNITLNGVYHRADQELNATRETVEFLTAIDPDTGLSRAYSLRETTGLAEDMALYSQRQLQAIENYSDTMSERTGTLSELWGQRNHIRTAVFLQSGSLYDAEDLPIENVFDGPPAISPNPGYFPGFHVPPGGFFSQVNY